MSSGRKIVFAQRLLYCRAYIVPIVKKVLNARSAAELIYSWRRMTGMFSLFI